MFSCEKPQSKIEIRGKTMGTYYRVLIWEKEIALLEERCDSVLAVVNQSLSNYISNSSINLLNASLDTVETDKMVYENLLVSRDVFMQSGGAFDPTVMPLVNTWGFGPKRRGSIPDSSTIDSLLQYIGFERLRILPDQRVFKQNSNIRLDLGGVAKGYGVDVLSSFLETCGLSSFLVDIGGEVRASGLASDGKPWLIALEKPSESISERAVEHYIELTDRSVASSGNYRNFYIEDGNKYAHEIDPKTGYPKIGTILAVSVMSASCAEADAWATAMMIMDTTEIRSIAKQRSDLGIMMIFDREGVAISEVFGPLKEALID